MFYVSDCSFNICTSVCCSFNGTIELKDLRTRSKKGETRSWTQKKPERKMSNDEAYRLERKEKETRSRTQEGKMSDDEAQYLERKEKEFEVKKDKEKVKDERVKKEREKVEDEKEKEVETQSWTKKDPERVMSDDEARRLERKRKRKRLRLGVGRRRFLKEKCLMMRLAV